MDIDLSKELVSPSPKPVLELQVEAARHGRLSTEVRNTLELGYFEIILISFGSWLLLTGRRK